MEDWRIVLRPKELRPKEWGSAATNPVFCESKWGSAAANPVFCESKWGSAAANTVFARKFRW